MGLLMETSFAQRLAEAIDNLVSDGIIINPVEMGIQLVATVVLIFVVKHFFWEKVTAFIEERQAIIDKDLNQAAALKEASNELKLEAEHELEEVRKEAKTILDNAKNQAADQSRQLLAKAKDEAASIKKSAQRDLAQEVELARRQLRQEIIEVAMELSERVIAQEISEDTYERLIDEAIEAVKQS